MKNMEVERGGFLTQNSTYDYPEDYRYEEDFESKDSKTSVLIPVLLFAMLGVGLVGNALLLFVLAQRRRLWRVSDIFIFNLGIADVLLLATLPFWAVQAAQQTGWGFGTVFCKICGAVVNIYFYCGIFLLVCISLDCYLSTFHGFQLYSHKKPMYVIASCLSVWFISLLFTIPDWIFLEAMEDEAQDKTLCVHTYTTSVSDRLWLCPRLLHHLVGLLLTAATAIVCYSYILLRLRRSSKDLQKQRPVTTLLLVGVVFIFWIPYNISLIVDTYSKISKEAHHSLNEASLHTALMVTFALGCAHACLRPVIYLTFCGNFRERTLAVLRSKAIVESEVEFESSLWELGMGKEALPAQRHELEALRQKTGAEQHVQSA